jgi:outer membrane lipoprotein-sorting protein
MDVKKLLKLKLLERERSSSGTLAVRSGGLLRWDITEPQKSMILIDAGKTLWLVDYPEDPAESVVVLRARDFGKSHSHAAIAALLSEGKITREFTVATERAIDSSHVELRLRALKNKKKKSAQGIEVLKNLTLTIDRESQIISKLSFEDDTGNVTDLEFVNVRFDHPVDDQLFVFKPPPNADVSDLMNK